MKIEKSTFDFLKELRENNNRDWFAENKNRYESALVNVKEFISQLIDGLSKFDPHINTEINPAKCLFRIYRDVRFSKNKDPYKTWFSAGISVDGRKLAGPEYYLHIEPSKSFIAVGYWRPEKDHLSKIRQELDYNSEGFYQALEAGGWGEKDLWQEDKLVRAPSGYAEDNPNAGLLKLKSFILTENRTDKEMQSTDAPDSILRISNSMFPFKSYIHMAID